MRITAKWISVSVAFAALYAVGVIFLAPISFGVVQVRVADALLPLSMVFGLPSVLGLSLGCLISNSYGSIGHLDVIGGPIANFLATFIAWFIAKRGGVTHRFIGSILETIIVTLIVGGYLSVIFDTPLELSLFGVLIGSIIAINILGFPLEEMIRRNLKSA
ncbi:MAG: QueT transporter family protein [Candidatus Bathyarchaeota archaeon]|nr:MAG: QueT transporter family protein [Candidatus Bathyarchaeota archaeon]